MASIRFDCAASRSIPRVQRENWRVRLRCSCQRLLLSACAGLVLSGTAGAQDFPTRQIVLVVPFPAGGSTDALARIIAEPMRIALGQPVVIQNVTGAGATIGVGRAIHPPPTVTRSASVTGRVTWAPVQSIGCHGMS